MELDAKLILIMKKENLSNVDHRIKMTSDLDFQQYQTKKSIKCLWRMQTTNVTTNTLPAQCCSSSYSIITHFPAGRKWIAGITLLQYYRYTVILMMISQTGVFFFFLLPQNNSQKENQKYPACDCQCGNSHHRQKLARSCCRALLFSTPWVFLKVSATKQKRKTMTG